jgi:hypothetical protein
MKITYSLRHIMKLAHREASKIRKMCGTYREALSKGLHKAWKVAKGLLPYVEVESAKVITEDVGQEFAQRCMGNIVQETAVA